MLAPFLFVLLAVVAIAAALGLIVSRNPVSSALWLVLNMMCIAGLYITLNAEFIGVIQVLVYAGAIMVLFLFVIMLLNLSELPSFEAFDWRRVIGFVAGIFVLALLVYVLAESFEVLPPTITAEVSADTGEAQRIGYELFTRYVLPLELIGILLLVATIGAVMLAKRRLI